MKNTILILTFAAFSSLTCLGADASDSTIVHFRQGRAELDTAYKSNGQHLDAMIGHIRAASENPWLTLKRVKVVGAASPEGPVALNNSLSHRRAEAIFNYVNSRQSLPDSLVAFEFLGRDWSGLREMVENDSNVPQRARVEQLLDRIVSTSTPATEGDSEAIREFITLDGGRPYAYLYDKLYPSLRESGMTVEYSLIPDATIEASDVSVFLPSPELEIMNFGVVRECKPFYMALKSNLLYDALVLPNIGAEFYVGKNISVAGNWMYGWWDKNSAHRYWRAYGGDLAVRWWFGSAAHNKPLTGHHIGLYAGVVTYDFEFGGTGYMGGLPGRTLWDRCNEFAGIEYGYSLPVARRLNIDFTIGIGYMGGKYIKYKPDGNCYVWESTHRLNWVGPTKAEISLVWLIGCDNFNRKGGVK